MLSFTSWLKILGVTALCFDLFACGTSNDQAPALDSTGKHPAGWLSGHRSAYRQTPNLCRECHGSDLKGGITKIDCFNQAGLGTCHAGGHGPRSIIHPLPFRDPRLHGSLAKTDLLVCQECHGTPGGPGSNARFNITIGSLATGCEASGCHIDRMAHPRPWRDHSSAGNLANACAVCHGATFEGGSGPSCRSCHVSLASGSVPTAGACVSCHGKPPVTNNHVKHNALGGVTNVCDTCHSGAGNGTASHDNGVVDVRLSAAYNAKTGAARFEVNKSCSNVSCHGGITTPVWGGSISVVVQCEACHLAGTAAQTPNYNSYFSGEHAKHLNEVGLKCIDCHDMTVTNAGASHFSNLATPAFELAPARTIRVPSYSTTPGSCTPGVTPQAGTYSVSVCHGAKTW